MFNTMVFYFACYFIIALGILLCFPCRFEIILLLLQFIIIKLLPAPPTSEEFICGNTLERSSLADGSEGWFLHSRSSWVWFRFILGVCWRRIPERGCWCCGGWWSQSVTSTSSSSSLYVKIPSIHPSGQPAKPTNTDDSQFTISQPEPLLPVSVSSSSSTANHHHRHHHRQERVL